MLSLWFVREVNGIFVGEVGDDFGRKEFGAAGNALGLEIGGIGLEPAAESVGADACERGKLGFGVGFHFAFSNRVATGFALLNNATDASALCIANLHYVSVYATSPLCCERE